MIGSKRILDLTRDVVATEAAVNGSTYLVTKAWVKEQQKKCAEFGTEVRITAGDLSKGQKTTQAK